ncbi:zinc finger protein 816-like [Phlebotomus argentipes]|uniref:zinc finger protein 816-like n=1 Tax=Phlebotomus argentipes TaxID=94469 RepID=UPI002893436E|nr:zinc finger protein 816-like [Phlebotomus argentipes]
MLKRVWGNTCRMCLENKIQCIDTDVPGTFKDYVSTILLEIFQITIVPEENLPQEVCFDCFAKSNSLWQFRQQVIENQQLLLQQVPESAVVAIEESDYVESEEYPGEEELDDGVLKEEYGIDEETAIEEDIIVEEPWEEDYSLAEESAIQADVMELIEESADEAPPVQEELIEKPTEEQQSKKRKWEKNPNVDSVLLEHFPQLATVVCPLDNMSWSEKDELLREFVKLKCRDCDSAQAFSTFDDLQDHYRLKHREKRCIVECCGKDFSRRDLLYAHVVVHKYPDAFSCFVCKRQFKGKELLKKHLFTHLPYELRPLQCEKCDKKFLANNQLRLHMLGHTQERRKSPAKRRSFPGITWAEGEETVEEEVMDDGTEMYKSIIDNKMRMYDKDRAIYEHFPDFDYIGSTSASVPLEERDEVIRRFVTLQCQECDARPTFPTFEMLQDHYAEQNHTNQPFVVCCNKNYYRKVNLINHITFHVNPNVFACPVCAHQSKSKELLKKHLYTHLPKAVRPLECAQCGKKYVTKAQLRLHVASHVRKEDRSHECPECGKKFAYDFALETHRRSHRRVPDYVCEICAKTFTGKSNYQDHKMRHHEIPEPVVCPICENTYKNKISLRSHMALHTDLREHKCEQCQKTFTARAGLLAHIRFVHSEQFLYHCNICKKKLRTKSDHKDHMANHLGQPMYHCEFCLKSFTARSYYFAHRKKAHPEEHAKLPKKQKFHVEN